MSQQPGPHTPLVEPAARGAMYPLERLNRALGELAGWMLLAMVLLGAWNAVGRFLGRFVGLTLTSNAFIELQWYLFSLVFLLAGADTLRRGRHVRVDVLYGRLGDSGRAAIDLAGSVLFLIPFSLFMLWVTWPSVVSSWRVWEGSPDPGGLPRYPIKSVVLVGFALLLLQGVAEAIRSWRRWQARRDADGVSPPPPPEMTR